MLKFSSRRCFNCGSTLHELSRCPQPRDRARVRRAIQEFKEEKAELGIDDDRGNRGRLHDTSADLQARTEWLEKFQPGRVSEELSQALGGAAGTVGQEPDWPWFARMAFWGYPPGKAK
jgi:predicted  nucleic acid-binding Zn-ribbon protein